MNKNKLKWVPKKVRTLFEKDSNYDINLYIKSKNIDLKNLPSGIDYEYEYLKTQYKWIYVLFFGILPLGILGIVFLILNFVWVNFWTQTRGQISVYAIIAIIFWISFWISYILWICLYIKNMNKKFKFYFNVFEDLINKDLLEKNLLFYPDMIKMCFYKETKILWKEDFPNSYPWFNLHLCNRGLCTFFDKLKNFLKLNQL